MTHQRLIFVVDDDAMYSQMLVDHLAADPLNRIRHFPTGEECLKHLHESPSFIILDYYLNQVDKEARNGLEILEMIKKVNREAKVVMLSGQKRYGVALQTVSKGAEEYVVKDQTAFQRIDEILLS